jgi:hypothetical protein
MSGGRSVGIVHLRTKGHGVCSLCSYSTQMSGRHAPPDRLKYDHDQQRQLVHVAFSLVTAVDELDTAPSSVIDVAVKHHARLNDIRTRTF